MTIKKLTMNVLIMTLVVGLAFLASVKIVFSQPIFYEGDFAQVQNTVVCDTEAELTLLIVAIQENGWEMGFKIGKTMIQSLGTNEIGETRCTGTGIEGWTFILVKTVALFSDVGWPSGSSHDTYIVAVLWQHKRHGIQTGFIMTTWPVLPREEEPQDEVL